MTGHLTISNLNDMLRTTFMTGRVVTTEGIRALPDATRDDIITKVRTFDGFTKDNDPYGEHDFGAFEHEGVGKVFWKIDYYDPTYTFGSEDLANPAVTRRVLTIMLAEEY